MDYETDNDQSQKLKAGQKKNTNPPDFDHPLLDDASVLEIFQEGNRHNFFKSIGWSTRKFMNTSNEEASELYRVWRKDQALPDLSCIHLHTIEVKKMKERVMDVLNQLTEEKDNNTGRDRSGRSSESFQNKIEEASDMGFLVTSLKDLEKQHGIAKTVSSRGERLCLPDAVHQILTNKFWTKDQFIPREKFLDKLSLQKYGKSWKEVRNTEARDFSIFDMNQYLANEGRRLSRPSFFRDFGLAPIFKQSKGCYLLLVSLSAVGYNWKDNHAIVYYAESNTLMDSTPNRKGLTIEEKDYNPTNGKAPKKASQQALDYFLNLNVDDGVKVKGALRAFFEITPILPRKKKTRPAKQRPRSKKKRAAKKRARSLKKGQPAKK